MLFPHMKQHVLIWWNIIIIDTKLCYLTRIQIKQEGIINAKKPFSLYIQMKNQSNSNDAVATPFSECNFESKLDWGTRSCDFTNHTFTIFTILLWVKILRSFSHSEWDSAARKSQSKITVSVEWKYLFPLFQSRIGSAFSRITAYAEFRRRCGQLSTITSTVSTKRANIPDVHITS